MCQEFVNVANEHLAGACECVCGMRELIEGAFRVVRGGVPAASECAVLIPPAPNGKISARCRSLPITSAPSTSSPPSIPSIPSILPLSSFALHGMQGPASLSVRRAASAIPSRCLSFVLPTIALFPRGHHACCACVCRTGATQGPSAATWSYLHAATHNNLVVPVGKGI